MNTVRGAHFHADHRLDPLLGCPQGDSELKTIKPAPIPLLTKFHFTFWPSLNIQQLGAGVCGDHSHEMAMRDRAAMTQSGSCESIE